MKVTTSNYSFNAIVPAGILTTSYVAGTVLGGTNQINNYLLDNYINSQLTLYVAVTIGSLTTVDMKVEFSNDGTTWYQETYDAIGSAATSAVTITESLIQRSFAASGNYRVAVKILDQFVRVSVKGTGTVTSSSVTINAIVGSN